MKIYVWHDEHEIGPFSKEEILLKLNASELALKKYARLEADTSWRTLGKVLNADVDVQKICVRTELKPTLGVKMFHSKSRSARVIHHQSAKKDNPVLGLLRDTVFLIVLACVVFVLFGWTLPSVVSAPLVDLLASEQKPTPAGRLAAQRSDPLQIPETVRQPKVDSTILPVVKERIDDQISSVAVRAMPSPGETVVEPLMEEVPAEPKEAHQPQILRPLPEPGAADFFKIHSVKIVKEAPRGDEGVWLHFDTRRFNWKEKVFIPYIEVTVQAAEQYESKDTFLRLHFFDQEKKLVQTLEEPAIAWRDRRRGYSVPPLYAKGQREKVYFPLPETVDVSTGSMLVLFGDQESAAARIHPSTTLTFGLDFPERALVERKVNEDIQREAAINPVVETVVETRNPKQPVITLFMRMPIGVKDAGQAKGVLALCLLANNAGQIRSMLQMMDRSEDGRRIHLPFPLLPWKSCLG